MRKLLVGLAFAAVATGAQAQNFTPMQNDQLLLQAINTMAYTLGGNCQSGIQASCQAYNYIMNNAGSMSQASDACLQGNQQGCQYYVMYYRQMETDYNTFTQSMQSSGGGQYAGTGGVNPLGETHQDRMNAIQNFGAQNTQNYQQRMDQMDRNQQSWMNSQR